MRGKGYRGHGGHNGKFPIHIVQSQYVNSDPFDMVRPSVKNTHGMISTSYKWINRPYPYATVQNQDQDASRIQMLAAATTKCDPFVVTGTNVVKGSCNNWTKPEKPDYATYYATTLLNKKDIPVPPKCEPYPPRVASNASCRTLRFT
jgi:hypothetical protein